MQILSKLNASVLHFVFFPGNTTNPKELDSMVEYITKQPSAQKKDLVNLCTLDNMTPLVFLACHPALKPPQSGNEIEEKARKNLMKMFTKKIKEEKQILLIFNLIARRRQLQQFDHLQHFVAVSSREIQEQMLHLACRHDNVLFLRWLINQEELKEHLNTVDYAGYTPLLTATFYNSENCVRELIKVCFHFLLTVIYKAMVG
jgi:hypothetical protein